MNNGTIDHDQLFKELLHQLFAEFMQLFFPEHAAKLDFTTVKFLEQEKFTDFPEGAHRYVDTLVEIKTLSGEPELILIHIEFQADRKSGFPLRMFRYFCQIRLRGDTRLFAGVLYLPSAPIGLGWEEYSEDLFGEGYLCYRFRCISLPKLSAAEYLKTKNPVAYGLAPLMDFENEMSRVELKAVCIVGIGECQNLTEVQSALLFHFLETYLKLTPEEEEEIQKRIVKEEVTPMQIVNPYIRRGEIQGELKAMHRTLTRLLQAKFSELPPDTVQWVQEIDSIEELDKLFEQAIHAESLDQVNLRKRA